MLGLLSGLLGGKGGALKQISNVIDELHTSEEEKLDKKILMQRIQQKLAEKQIDVNLKEGAHKSIFRRWLAAHDRLDGGLCANF